MDDLLANLSDELNAFLSAYGLPQQSADEVLHGLYTDDDVTDLVELQIEYLTNFIKRWDIAESSD
jgi:hypothetical protein